MRKLHEHDFGEEVPVLRGKGVHQLFHRLVDGVHTGNALDETLGQPAKILAKDVTREVAQTGDHQQHDNGGNGVPEQGKALQRPRQVGFEQRTERATDQVEDPAKNPDGDRQRRQQEEPGEKGVAKGSEQTLVHEKAEQRMMCAALRERT